MIPGALDPSAGAPQGAILSVAVADMYRDRHAPSNVRKALMIGQAFRDRPSGEPLGLIARLLIAAMAAVPGLFLAKAVGNGIREGFGEPAGTATMLLVAAVVITAGGVLLRAGWLRLAPRR